LLTFFLSTLKKGPPGVRSRRRLSEPNIVHRTFPTPTKFENVPLQYHVGFINKATWETKNVSKVACPLLCQTGVKVILSIPGRQSRRRPLSSPPACAWPPGPSRSAWRTPATITRPEGWIVFFCWRRNWGRFVAARVALDSGLRPVLLWSNHPSHTVRLLRL
jgi:hypothetical protein